MENMKYGDNRKRKVSMLVTTNGLDTRISVVRFQPIAQR
jgi:hypothetical protein